MPRYFFHVHDGKEVIDKVGCLLASLEAARIEAIRYSARLLSLEPAEFWNSGEWKLRVTDQDGLTFFQLVFFAMDAPAGRIA